MASVSPSAASPLGARGGTAIVTGRRVGTFRTTHVVHQCRWLDGAASSPGFVKGEWRRESSALSVRSGREIGAPPSPADLA
jgi:hypothetical protein